MNLPVLSSEGNLAFYLQEIKKFPILTANEEFMLAKRYKEQGDTKAAHKLVTSHLRLVAKIAMGYRGYGLPITDLISEGNVVGWYQGKMEWGPRALGNRSILADPRNAKMKDILNEKIKHRESFRPFAPCILEEYAPEYFDIDIPSPYMLLVAPVKKPEKIPAVTHVDGTGRLQTVSKEINPLFYDLINEFYKTTGVPVLINTSMNVRGEPIVNTLEQAYSMIIKTDMDYIVLGNYIVKKE